MKKINPSVEHTGIRYGLLTSLALIGYFLIMQAVGLGHILELRFLNFIILAYGIYFGLTNLKNNKVESDFYLKGLAEGFLITLVAVIPFSAFVSFYLEYIDANLMNEIRQSIPISGYISGLSTFIVVNLEGIASGAITTFAAMQYLKSEPIPNKGKIQEKSHVET